MTVAPSKPSRVLAAVAVGASALGPMVALVYERGGLNVFADRSHDLWLVVAVAMCGVGLGAYAAIRGPRVLGVVCMVCNLGVLALYGFIATFFALGGSR